MHVPQPVSFGSHNFGHIDSKVEYRQAATFLHFNSHYTSQPKLALLKQEPGLRKVKRKESIHRQMDDEDSKSPQLPGPFAPAPPLLPQEDSHSKK